MSAVQLSYNNVIMSTVESKSSKPLQYQFITKAAATSEYSGTSSIDDVTISPEALIKSTIFKAMTEAAMINNPIAGYENLKP